MERLTKLQIKRTDKYYMKCSETCPDDCEEICDCEEFDEFVNRLGSIEDILGADYDLNRLRELVEADRAGRCVVLPCEVGDSVWVTMAYGKQYNPPVHGHINKFVLHDDEIFYLEAIIWMDIGAGKRGYGYSENSFGKIVFLTPEAAEAALKGEPPC